MKRYNAYTLDVDEYNREHGTDIFIEYKDPNTTEERKKEIEDWLFNLMRTKNEVPFVELSDTESVQALIAFSEVDSRTVYNPETGEYGYNPTGGTFLNRFFPEILDVKKVGNPKSIRETFYIDSKLRRCIRKSLKYANNILGFYRWFLISGGAGYCTNFRPATAKAIYEVHGSKPECRVLDSSAGFGARLLGAHFASNVIEYLGIDPNTADHCGDLIEYLDSNFDTHTKKQVLKMGSEDFTPELFPQYQDYFDLYFTSPPYFNTEMYSEDETQSYKKFPTYAGWVTGFYKQTIYNACDALKVDGEFVINIFEKVPNIKELTKLFLADKGFYVYRNDKYLMKTVPGTYKDKETGEFVSRTQVRPNSVEPIWGAAHYSRLYHMGLITLEQALAYKERATQDKKVFDL